MRIHTFGGWVEFGRGDYGNTPVDFDLTEAEYEAVMQHIDAGDTFSDCDDLQDLYDRVRAAAEQQIREELEAEVAEGYEHGDGKDVLAYYNVGVNFEYTE